jgi:D-cysteine desulfhydrase family pyridoxal phosphate-dependent enzyme
MTVLSYPARVQLGHFPTPIERLERLSRHLNGPEIYIKRDDQTGLGTGGNKTRKLEFVLAEAVAQGCHHMVTLGGPQSNHCRQTAAAAAKLGLACSVVLRGSPPPMPLGNLLLDHLFGAQIHWSRKQTREEVADELVTGLRGLGVKTYLVPLGASTPLGALGYVLALQETLAQLKEKGIEIDTIVLASSSAGTQAGLVAGAALLKFPGTILGISIDATAEDLGSRVRNLAAGACTLLGRPAGSAEVPLRVEVNADYLGAGYSIVGDLERNAIRTLARSEGILLDPVYTGRAFGGLLDLIARGEFKRNQKILFWHTGGAAAMSAFAEDFKWLPQSETL